MRQRKNLLTSVGIEPTTSGIDLPLLCRLSYKVAQRKSVSRLFTDYIRGKYKNSLDEEYHKVVGEFFGKSVYCHTKNSEKEEC